MTSSCSRERRVATAKLRSECLAVQAFSVISNLARPTYLDAREECEYDLAQRRGHRLAA